MKPIVIIGNGPSVKDLELERICIDSFGMNNAYRHYMQEGWYPTYHGCFDERVCEHHAYHFYQYAIASDDRLKMIMLPRTKYPQQKILEFGWNDPTYTFVYPPEDCKKCPNVGSTGASCCQAAIAMGYNKLFLIGIDQDYQAEQAIVPLQGKGRKFVGKPSNINYGFDGYLQEGDVINEPNADIYHIPAWRNLSETYKAGGIEVINCSPTSKIKGLFPFMSLEESGIYG